MLGHSHHPWEHFVQLTKEKVDHKPSSPDTMKAEYVALENLAAFKNLRRK